MFDPSQSPRDLFPSPEPAVRTLVSDAEGGIRLAAGLIDADLCAAWFEGLRDDVAWQVQRRPMYDRVVDVPRLVAAYPLAGEGALVQRFRDIRQTLRDAWRTIPGLADLADAPFDSVGLNLYRDGQDSVAMHNDKLRSIVDGQPIVLLSLGATRRMSIRAKEPPRTSLHVALAAGDVVAMSHASQRTHDHGIPKTTGEVGPRISLAFRVRTTRDLL